ncbi:hypothetical protein QZH41_017087, partial [Actinostola sp. cb2023]
DRENYGLIQFVLQLTNFQIHAEESSKFANTKFNFGTQNELRNPLDKVNLLHNVYLLQVVPIPELSLVSVKLTHDATGAQHLHIARDDANNVFGVGFRTTPMDSTGVSHILEHTTLCGSDKYPCRDPFFKMLNRSLATFMNAFTASDVTMYPFSTQNPKDFQNLLAVYLDAVFFPQLKELDFWLSLPFHSFPFIILTQSLTYIFSLISKSKWEQLKQFHSTHYHPSNARFYTYGDTPVEEHLQHINNLALKHFERLETETEIPHEKRWTVSIACATRLPPHVLYCPVSCHKQLTPISINCLCFSTTDPFEGFVMSILSSLLIDGPTSPFYQALIEPNIGSDYSPGTGYDNGTKDSSFSIGLKGIKPDDVDRVKKIIHETFDKVIEEGIPQERIKAVMHRIELSIKHQSANFGLGLMMSLMQPWNHGGDPTEFLKVNEYVEQFKECLKDEQFLQNKIKEHFKKNPHCLTLVMNPDADHEAKLSEKEKEKLAEKTASLTPEDKDIIHSKCLQLAELQNTVQDASCLPVMHIADIEPKVKPVAFDECIIAGVPVQFSEQPTNGITYFRAISSISDIPDELKPYLPLFCFVVTKMGAGNLGYKDLAQMIERRTGGLSVGTHVCTHHTDNDKYEQGMIFSSHCLDDNLPHMFYLWGEIFARPTLDDQDRLRTLINMIASDLANSIAHSGHSYAMSLASSSLTPAAKLGELFGGLSQVLFMKNLVEAEDLTAIIQTLRTIAIHVLEGTQFRCAVNMVPGSRSAVETALEGYCDALPAAWSDTSGIITDPNFVAQSSKTHFQLPFPVNYSSRSVNAVTYNHEDYAKLRILAKVLSSKYLHREIREKGGAYGSGASLGGSIFSFYSYRDPNSLDTLEVFNKSIEWAEQGQFTDQDIDEAKLSVFASVDSPVSPGNRGLAYFSQGVTEEMKQTQRDRLFAVTRDDLIDVTRR